MIMEPLVYQEEVHKVRYWVEHLSLVCHYVSHSKLYFGVCIRYHHEHLIKLYTDHLCLVQDRISLIQLHLYILQAVLVWWVVNDEVFLFVLFYFLNRHFRKDFAVSFALFDLVLIHYVY